MNDINLKPDREEPGISHVDKTQYHSNELIHSYVEAKNYREIKNFLKDMHPADIGSAISSFKKMEDSLFLLRLCEPELQSIVFLELSEELQAKLAEQLKASEISPLIEDMESDDATNLIEDISEISPHKAEEILNTLGKIDSEKIRSLLNYPDHTAGRLMNLDFAMVRENHNAGRAINSIRKAARATDNIYVIYVTDANGIVRGYVNLKDLILAHQMTKINKIMKPIHTIHVDTDQEEVARFFSKYDLVSAPVVDDEGRMLGRITVDDVLDIVQEEASEDILRLGGVGEDERLKTPIYESVKRRLVWLNLNLFTAVMVSGVVSYFEDTIQKLVVLASLMPIVGGMGGNAGTQAITIVVRNLATGDLTLFNWFTAVRKELVIGIINGFSLGTVTGLITFILKGDVVLSLVIGMAMFFNMIMAGLVGSAVPLVLKFFRIDPAIASSIFVTACTDTFGFFCFLGLATLYMF